MKRRNPVLHAMGVSALIVAVVALAAPAWAANDEAPRHGEGPNADAAFELCKRAGGNASNVSIANICAMKHVYDEDMALRAAKSILDQCDKSFKFVADCNVERAYIKQRWGY